MRADRLISFMLLLHQRGRMTARDLSEALEVSERTIYRDLDALSAAGIPIYSQSGANGGIFLDEAYRISLTDLSRRDVQALFVSAERSPLDELGLKQSSALLKLFAELPTAERSAVERMHQRLHIDPANWFQAVEPSRFLPALQQATWEDRRIQIQYQAIETEASRRVLDAYALVAKANVWYLVAKKSDAPVSEMRSFRVARIEALELLDERFERDPAFDLAAYWAEARERFERESQVSMPILAAVLRVHPSAFWVFPGYHEGWYEKIGQPDADGWITLRVRFQSFFDAHARVTGLGGQVEIIEPDALRESVLETAREILAHALTSSPIAPDQTNPPRFTSDPPVK